MPSYLWLLPIAALLLDGALLNILALRRRWASPERWLALYLVAALANAFAQTLSYGVWPDSTLGHLIADSTFYTEIALAFAFLPLARIFLQLNTRLRWVAGGAVLLLLLTIPDGLGLTLDTPFGLLPYSTILRWPAMLLIFAAFGIAGLDTFFQFRRHNSPLHRNRLLYLSIALSLQFLGGALGLVLMPPAPVLAVLLRVIATVVIAYAVLRHNLADLYFLARQVVNYALLTLLTIGIYVICFQVSTLLLADIVGSEPLMIVAAAGTALALLYEPLRDIMRRILDAALFGRHYNRERIIQDFSQWVSAIQDVETLAHDAAALVKRALGAQDAALLVAQNDETSCRLLRPPNGAALTLAPDNPVLTEFKNRRSRHLLQYDIDLAPQFCNIDAETRQQLARLRAEVWIPIHSQEEFIGLWAIGPRRSGERYTDQDLTLLATLADQTAVALQNTRLEGARRAEAQEKEQVREIFSRYVAPSVVKHVLDDQSRIALGGERQEVTVLFADIQGFTSLAEKLPAKELVQVLNGYLALAAGIILKHEGTLDKFMGDGLMALFNAPLNQPDHAVRAAQAAIAIQNEVIAYSGNLPDYARLMFRIGVHTGEAIVGNIGTCDLMNYTAVGDTVNIAKRLQENARGGQILITQTTLAQAMNIVKARPFSSLNVKGRVQPVMTFEVIAS